MAYGDFRTGEIILENLTEEEKRQLQALKGHHWNFPEREQAQIAGRQAIAGASQQRISGEPSFPPSIAAPLAVDPSGIMDMVRPESQKIYEVPGTTIMGEVPAPLAVRGLFDVAGGAGQGWGEKDTGTKGVYEEEGGFKFDQKKWNDTLAGLAALAPPKDLPTPTLNLNQISARTVQGGGGPMTPFNPDNTASTAFKDRNIAPQILKFLR